MKYLSNITPIFRTDFAGLVLTLKNSIGKDREISTPLSLNPDKEEFSFIWVYFQFIR